MAAYCPCGCRSGPMTGATGRRVLLVDDEPDILTVARIVMTSHGGYAVRTYTSGAEALAVAPEFAPDLVIIDVMMPDMDGPFTLRLLRETAGLRDTPVVFLTAKAQPTEVVRYRALGAVDVLAKPLTIGPWSSRSGDFLTTLARRAKGWTEKSPPSRLGLPPDCPSGLARSSARGRTLATAMATRRRCCALSSIGSRVPHRASAMEKSATSREVSSAFSSGCSTMVSGRTPKKPATSRRTSPRYAASCRDGALPIDQAPPSSGARGVPTAQAPIRPRSPPPRIRAASPRGRRA